MTVLEARNLVCEYVDGADRLRVLDGVSLSIRGGTSTAILGPSGSGKSTLLYSLSGIRRATSGTVALDGCDLSTLSPAAAADIRRKNFGFVFQQHFLVKHMTVMENIFVALQKPTAADSEHAEQLLRQLGIAGMGHRFPHQLSGGQRQRVALARAIIHRPRVLFADEPSASLDRSSSSQLLDLLLELRGETALVMVTHDQEYLDRFDSVFELRSGHLTSCRAAESIA